MIAALLRRPPRTCRSRQLTLSIQLPADEPLRVRRLPVEDSVPGARPFELAGELGPEALLDRVRPRRRSSRRGRSPCAWNAGDGGKVRSSRRRSAYSAAFLWSLKRKDTVPSARFESGQAEAYTGRMRGVAGDPPCSRHGPDYDWLGGMSMTGGAPASCGRSPRRAGRRGSRTPGPANKREDELERRSPGRCRRRRPSCSRSSGGMLPLVDEPLAAPRAASARAAA